MKVVVRVLGDDVVHSLVTRHPDRLETCPQSDMMCSGVR